MATDETLGRTLLLIIAVILLLPVLMMLLAWPMIGLWGGGHMWNGTTGVGWVTMMVLWLVPLAVVLGVGYLLYRALVGSSSRESDRALEELRVAYARGELSDEEFEQRRERLRRER
jgi:putative membrane protein